MRVSLAPSGKTDEKNVITNNEIKDDMKTIRLFQASMLLALTLIVAGCGNDEVAKNEQQGANGIPAGATVFSGETHPDTQTRTAIVDHTKGGSAKVNWAATDKVWVKDDASAWQQSGAAIFPVAANKAKAMFSLNGTYTGATHDVIYTNLPITGTPQVEIKAAQSQATPNNFDHAGEAGDCAIATAHGGNGGYSFLLDHKSSYLCFLPRCMNVDLGKNIYLTKITITADKPIAGTFNIAGGSIAGNAPAANSSNTITLATTNFPLNTTVADVTKNAAYMVIAPGTYNFTIVYTIKDPTTNVEGTITKTLTSFTCDEGKIHDITAWIDKDLEDVTGSYYTWDATVGEHYWKGHDRDVSGNFFSTLTYNSGFTPNYPGLATDSRWYNTAYGYAQSSPATRSAAGQPNVNLMAHYVQFGDPRWDANRIWIGFGHLYKGGIWLKRRTSSGFANKSTDYWGVDYRTYTQLHIDNRADILYNNTTIPTEAEQATTYFFLPASGYFFEGKMTGLGVGGHYWSSSASSYVSNYSWYFFFSKTAIHVRQFYRSIGSRIAKFY